MSAYLLDVNLLLALTDPMHIHHDVAHRWFGSGGATSWATCPLTENGFVRISSHPRYPNRSGGVATSLAILRRLCTFQGHQFWPEDITIRDLLKPDTIITHAHVTDIFLLGLAASRGGKLATLDRRLPATAIEHGPESLELLVP